MVIFYWWNRTYYIFCKPVWLLSLPPLPLDIAKSRTHLGDWTTARTISGLGWERCLFMFLDGISDFGIRLDFTTQRVVESVPWTRWTLQLTAGWAGQQPLLGRTEGPKGVLIHLCWIFQFWRWRPVVGGPLLPQQRDRSAGSEEGHGPQCALGLCTAGFQGRPCPPSRMSW